MSKAPSYYRARIAAIQAAIAYELTLPESREREMRIAYLRNGHEPEKFLQPDQSKYHFINTEAFGSRSQTIDEAILHFTTIQNQHTNPARPLEQDEIAQYDTWFAMHPEKVCGKQVGGSGYSFPVKTLGSRQDIERAIDTTLSNHATRHSPPGAEVASGKRQVSSDDVIPHDGWENHLIKARSYAIDLGLRDPIIMTNDTDGIVALINNHLHSTPAPSSVKRQVSSDDLELSKAIAIAAKAELELLELELELA